MPFANVSRKKFCSHTFKASSKEVIVMSSKKMKAKYIKEDMWKSFFRELAGCHLAASLRINLFTGNFQWTPSNGFLSFLYKILEWHQWNSFSLFLLIEILPLLHEISSFSKVLYERGVLKNFSKFTDKFNKQSSRGALSKEVRKNFAKLA